MSYNPEIKQFFDTIDFEQVEHEIYYLKNSLPKKPTRKNYQLNRKMLKAKKIKKANLQDKLQEIADLMCAHLEINTPIKILTIQMEGAKFETVNNLQCIFISDDMEKFSFKQKVATLAHEMSHYYLIRKHNIHRPTEATNEFLTEINAVYTGFGIILLRGYKEYQTQIGNQIFKTTTGYIKPDIVYHAIIKTAYVRKQNPYWIIKNLPFPYNLNSIFDLFKLIIEYRKKMKQLKNKSS